MHAEFQHWKKQETGTFTLYSQKMLTISVTCALYRRTAIQSSTSRDSGQAHSQVILMFS